MFVAQLPVLVAGAGPVGCVLALHLAKAGIPVVLIEREADLPEDLRASTFHPPTLDMLDGLGLTDALLGLGVLAPTHQYRDRQSGRHAVFDLALLAGETRHPYRLQCEQYKLTRLVCDELRRHPHAQVRMGCRVLAVRQHADRVEVQIAGPQGASDLVASFLVGADGASSVVRKQVGIAFEGITYPEKFLVLSTDAALDAALPNLSGVNYVADALEWCTILKTRTLWRVLFPADASVSDEQLVADEAVQARLQRLAPSRVPYRVEHRTLYRVHQRVASQFRLGRVLLAGDAAHVNNPLGGMGMNGGIHDALALAAALEAAYRDPATGQAALDHYAGTRRAVAVEFINEHTARNKRQMEERDPAKRQAHLDEMIALAADPVRARAYLMKTSMIEALRRVGWVGGRESAATAA